MRYVEKKPVIVAEHLLNKEGELSSEDIKANNPDGMINSDPNLSKDKKSNRPPRSQYKYLKG